jgi:hypothetical protein
MLCLRAAVVHQANSIGYASKAWTMA